MTPQRGYVEVITFLASTCIPCQHVIKPIKELENTYSERNVNFTYVFSHDMLADAKEFSRVNKINKSSALIAHHDILKAFHDPLLPTIYIADQRGWLLKRFQKFNMKEFKELQTLLETLSVF